jgi:hypothetical protein
VRIAEADLVPTKANLLEAYPDMRSLHAARDAFSAGVNGRRYRETRAIPRRAADRRTRATVRTGLGTLCRSLGETRLANTDQRSAVRGALLPPPGSSVPQCGSREVGTSWSSSPIWAHYRCGRTGPGTTGRPDQGDPACPVHPGLPRIELSHHSGHPQDPARRPRNRPTRPRLRSSRSDPTPRPG